MRVIVGRGLQPSGCGGPGGKRVFQLQFLAEFLFLLHLSNLGQGRVYSVECRLAALNGISTKWRNDYEILNTLFAVVGLILCSVIRFCGHRPRGGGRYSKKELH